MITSPSDTYTLTLWFTGRPEKLWIELSGKEIARFEHEYSKFQQSEHSKAVFVLDTDEKKRTIRLDMLTDFSVIPNTD